MFHVLISVSLPRLQKRGTANPSIVEQMIQQQHLGETSSYLDETIIMHISGSMYLGKSTYSFCLNLNLNNVRR